MFIDWYLSTSDKHINNASVISTHIGKIRHVGRKMCDVSFKPSVNPNKAWQLVKQLIIPVNVINL